MIKDIVLPPERAIRMGSCGTFIVETQNSTYAFDIDRWSTGVRAIKGGSVLDGLPDQHRGVLLDQVILNASVRRVCGTCDVVHDDTDLADMYVGKQFHFRVGKYNVDTSTVTACYFV